MPEATVFDVQGREQGKIDLPQAVWGQEVNLSLLRASVLSHLAKIRRGTASTKTRAEVSGGGRKPWRQKGTGRARQGTIRSPLWRHGGIVFGPHPRDYGWDLPKAMRRKALVSALSSKARDGRVLVVDNITLERPRTRELRALLDNLGVRQSALVVTARPDTNVVLSARNLPGVSVVAAQDIGVYDIMIHRHLVVTRDALSKLEEVLA